MVTDQNTTYICNSLIIIFERIFYPTFMINASVHSIFNKYKRYGVITKRKKFCGSFANDTCCYWPHTKFSLKNLLKTFIPSRHHENSTFKLVMNHIPIFLYNSNSHSSINFKIPNELFYNRLVDISHFKVINNNDSLDSNVNKKRSIQEDEDSDDYSDIQTLNI
ncbi:hypothetical protein H8356DRAFT_1363289 [Neocallimastix lanati (nom. inval.)]|nr:hypothetical protein H8356DRAFT_1363289 [Neocallimastix sp. JGI-2020a]